MIIQMSKGPTEVFNINGKSFGIDLHAAAEFFTEHFVGNQNIRDDDLILPRRAPLPDAHANTPGKKLRVLLDVRYKIKKLLW